MASLKEVFGISTEPVQSYVLRPDVDDKFVQSLKSHHHLVVYGSSKQGKTTLRQKHVRESDCVIYRCGPKSTTAGIYQAVLKEAGILIERAVAQTELSKGTVKGSWGFKAILPLIGGTQASGEVSLEAGKQKMLTREYVDTDIGDAQVVGDLLKDADFDKFIVLENFHYLRPEVQRELAYDLKTFHELSIRFVILGVWRESNRLLIDNPDLQERIAEIPVEPWQDSDFDSVIETGAKVLNVDIPVKARNEFKASAFGNVGLLQEFLQRYCFLNGILETAHSLRTLDDGDTIPKTIAEKASEQESRLLNVLEEISSHSRTEGRQGRREPLTLPYYLVQVLLTAPIGELTDGITRAHLLEKIRALHRRGDNSIRTSDVTHLLKQLPAFQTNTHSPFLYESNLVLKIADAGLLFALAKCDRTSLLDQILDPLEQYDD